MRLSVVVSQSPSKNPAKRKLEEDIVTGLLFENGIDVTVVPNLYDIKPCLLYTSPSPRDQRGSRMPSSA